MKTFLHCSLILFLLVLSVSCKKDNDGSSTSTPDTTGPSVTLTGVNAGDTLRNVVTAEIKAEDKDKVVKLEAFANDSLVSTAMTGALKLSWETFKYKDGEYNLKVIATDGAGNKKELVTKVILNNALISINSLVDGAYETTSYIITDSAGKILNTLKFPKSTPNTGKYTINPRIAFTGKKVNVMRIRQNPSTNVKYFIDIKRGDLFTGPTIANSNFKINFTNGETQLALKNVPQNANYTVSNAYGRGTSQNSSIPKLGYSLSKSFLLQLESSNSAKYHFVDVPANTANFDIDASLADKVSLSRVITFPANIEEGAIVAYCRVEKGFDDAYTVAVKNFYNLSSTRVFYPEGLTDEFYGNVFFRAKPFDYRINYLDIIPAVITRPDFDINPQSQSIQNFVASFTGDFQYYRATFVSTGQGAIEVYGLRSQTQFKFPDISAEISLGIDFNKMFLYKLGMYKYSHPVDYKMNILTAYNDNSLNYTTDKKATAILVEKLIN